MSHTAWERGRVMWLCENEIQCAGTSSRSIATVGKDLLIQTVRGLV
jgi:hypothetical protein